MFPEPIKIGVFCGFLTNSADPNIKCSEKDFAYKLLCVFDHGKLTEDEGKPKIGDQCLNHEFLIDNFKNGRYEFRLAQEWSSQNPASSSMEIIKDSDLIVGIFAKRDEGFETSLYTMLEVAAAHGHQVPILPVIEDSVPEKSLSMLKDCFSWHRKVNRQDFEDREKCEYLQRAFASAVNTALLHRKKIKTLDETEVDKLYVHLIDTLLWSQSVKIYNHSALPVCSGLDPFAQGDSFFSDFKGVLKLPWTQFPHRALYFEVEEALVTWNWVRVEQLLGDIGKKWFKPEHQIVKRIREVKEDSKKRITLHRAASVMTEAEYNILSSSTEVGDQNKCQEALARIASLIAQVWRLGQAETEKNPIEYTLTVFPTISTQSSPTTVYALRESGTKRLQRGIWGFLRGPDDEVDRFIYAQNDEAVDIWKEYVSSFFDRHGKQYNAQKMYVKEAPYLQNLFKIVGKKAAQEAFTFMQKMQMMRDKASGIVQCAPDKFLGWYKQELDEWIKSIQD